MVIPLRGAAAFAALIEAFYTRIQALDTTGYRGSDSDRWTQARSTELDGHLHFWVDLGSNIDFRKPHLQFEGAIVFASRYQANDDSVPQARIHAAAYHVFETLLSFDHDGARATPGGWELSGSAPEWVTVTVPFTLLLPLSRG